MLLIASEGQGANKIEPVLTYEYKDQPQTYDARVPGHRDHQPADPDLQRLLAAPVPGVHHRLGLLLRRARRGRASCRASWWPKTASARPTGRPARTAFGGQINASSNGDLPGDIYRLIGGVVLRKKGEAPLYAGYIASAFLLPKGSNNNRVVAAGLRGPDRARPAKRRASSWWARGPAWCTRPAPAFAPAAADRPDPAGERQLHAGLPGRPARVCDGNGRQLRQLCGHDPLAAGYSRPLPLPAFRRMAGAQGHHARAARHRGGDLRDREQQAGQRPGTGGEPAGAVYLQPAVRDDHLRPTARPRRCTTPRSFRGR